MFAVEYGLIIGAIGIVAGLIGSLVGLGGAVVLTPLLTLAFGIPLPYAAGAGLVSAVATSSGSGIAYVKERIANIRIGMSLEIGTTLGAIAGALLAGYAYERGLDPLMFIIFGAVLLLSIYPAIKRKKVMKQDLADSSTRAFQLRGSYYDESVKKRISYSGRRWWKGELIMTFAGLISGLLGIGSGALKVLAMNEIMNIPEKVSTTTSNFMIGVTAAVGSVIYWQLGYVQPFVAGAAAVGIIIGAFISSRYLNRIREGRITSVFLAVLIIIGIEMMLRGFGVGV